MNAPLKYALIERERRFLVARIPSGVVTVRQISDRYIDGTRLRLREIIDADDTVTRKLGHKVRLGTRPDEVACTSIYLDDHEWELLQSLPARTLRKTRHVVERHGLRLAVDQLQDGTLLAEIDDGAMEPVAVPAWLNVIREVTSEEQWTGANLAC